MNLDKDGLKDYKALTGDDPKNLNLEQLEQRKLTQNEFSNLRSEMNSGFRETRELIITLNNEK